MIDIYCVELDRIDRDWLCFPPVGNGELSAECDPTMVCQEDGEEDVGRVELCASLCVHHPAAQTGPCSSLETGAGSS